MTGSGTGSGERLVLDCSAVMALFVQESYTPQAEKILQDAFRNKTELLVPDLTFVECANVMWKYVRKGLSQVDKAQEVLRRVSELPLSSVPTRALFDEALGAAVKLGITAYDAVYVVLARKTGSDFITGDKRLKRSEIGGRYLGDM